MNKYLVKIAESQQNNNLANAGGAVALTGAGAGAGYGLGHRIGGAVAGLGTKAPSEMTSNLDRAMHRANVSRLKDVGARRGRLIGGVAGGLGAAALAYHLHNKDN